MDNNTCFSIYAVESNVGEPKTGLSGQDYHAFLVLVDETPDQGSEAVEELHFVMRCDGLSEGQEPYMHAVTKRTNRDLSELKTYGYVGGKSDVMLPVWNKAIDIGLKVSLLEKSFSTAAGQEAINCRAGVKAVIDGLGLQYEPVLLGGSVEAGTQSDIVNDIPAEVLEDVPYF